ncbi:MAG: zinc ABC transporter substrate-binding protein, partial [Actinomycetes bacterium]
VAAENSWGSIASLLGGDRVQVYSIVQDPNVDPHEYEASPADARLVANAQLVVNNGGGYDAWMQQLLSPGARVQQRLVTAAVLVPAAALANPHLFASPGVVELMIHQITANLEAIEPASISYFKSREAKVMADWKRWDKALLAIAAAHRANPVGAMEPMALPMLARASLQVITAKSFMRAISQGIEPAPKDLVNFNSTIDHHRIDLLVTNSQTVTPLTAGLVSRAQAAGIPVVAVVETLPKGKSFFQVVQGEAAALAQALGSTSP